MKKTMLFIFGIMLLFGTLNIASAQYANNVTIDNTGCGEDGECFAHISGKNDDGTSFSE